MNWFVYILRCSDGTLYCGSTNDLERRIQKHNEGRGAKYTRGRRPVELVFSKEFVDKLTALRQERDIKKLSRFEKIALITREVLD